MKSKNLYQHLYFQVLTAISIGICLGHFYPETGVATIVISRWEKELDMTRMSLVLNDEDEADVEEPEAFLEGIRESAGEATVNQA